MENQRFIPEGWNQGDTVLTKEKLMNAMQENAILQGRVIACDDSYNLHLETTGELKDAIIPREEVEAIYTDSLGYPKPNICSNKVNKLVQFRVNDVREDTAILSRKKVGMQAIGWVRNELKPGDIVHRNYY